MADLWVLLTVFVLMPAAVHHVFGDKPDIRIDCGLPEDIGSYTDNVTGTTYDSDAKYIDAGENHNVAAASSQSAGRVPMMQSLRSFPSGKWNCYTLPTSNAGGTYLVRAQFEYGNYDGKNSSLVQFALHLGVQVWATVTLTLDVSNVTKEAVFIAWTSWTPVCLENTGTSTPFVSVLELMDLGPPNQVQYAPVNMSQAMSTYSRLNMGTDEYLTRRPDDPHDRFWFGMTSPQWTNVKIPDNITPDPTFYVPSAILQTAVAPVEPNSTSLTVPVPEKQYGGAIASKSEYMAFLHFADNQRTQAREFDIYINGKLQGPSPYSPKYLQGSCVTSETYIAPDGMHNITLVATAHSELAPANAQRT